MNIIFSLLNQNKISLYFLSKKYNQSKELQTKKNFLEIQNSNSAMSNKQDASYVEIKKQAQRKHIYQKPISTSQKQLSNEQDLKTFMLSQNIQRSSELSNQDLEEQTSQVEKQPQNNTALLTSLYGSLQMKEKYQKPKQQQINLTHNMQKSPINHPQNEQLYESISSDRSNEQKQQEVLKNNDNEEKLSKNQPSTVSKGTGLNPSLNKQNIVFRKSQSIVSQGIIMKEAPIASSDKYNVSLRKQESEGQKHTTFEFSRQNIHTSQNTNQFTLSRQWIQNDKRLGSFRSNRASFQASKQSRQAEYPSLLKSNSQQHVALKFQQRKNIFKQNNFGESMSCSKSKKSFGVVSNRLKGQQNSQQESEYLNEKYPRDNKMEVIQKKTERTQGVNSKQQSNLFYVSISGQQFYPSLDLKLKAKQIQNSNKFISQNKPCKTIKQSKKQHLIKKSSAKTNHQPQLPCRIKISQYRSQFFLKIQTQVFDIEVEYPLSNKIIQMKDIPPTRNDSKENQKSDKNYTIKRRFSDFAFLYQGIMINQIGYIIYPFPSKSLQSFVKIKLQSFIGTALSDGSNVTQTQKVQLIERRIQELQKFVNFLISHQQLKYSQELGIFLCEDLQTYQRSRQRIQKYIQQYKELESSNNLIEMGKKNIQKAIQTGVGMVMKWWSSAQSPVQDLNKKIQKSKQSRQMLIDTIPEQDIQFGQYFETIGICLSKFQMLERSMIKLVQINQKFISFKDIDTEFDYLVKLCAKVSSGKEYSKNLVQLIEFDLIKDIQSGRRWLEQSKDQLIKREELKQLIENLKQSLTSSNDESSKISKLQRRLERFEKNFRYGFKSLIVECQKIFEKSRHKFIQEWRGHCSNMKKIWK